jgi:hypothetical protein
MCSNKLVTLRRATQGTLQRLEPLQLHAGAGVENNLARDWDIFKEPNAESGGARDGEVGAILVVIVSWPQKRPDEGQL